MDRSTLSMASASSSASSPTGSEDDIHPNLKPMHSHTTTALRPSIEVGPTDRRTMSISMPTSSLEHEHTLENGQEHCDKNHDPFDAKIAIMSNSKQAGMTVAPFLAKHIPEQYAPMGVKMADSKKDPNTKYCYRHRPDSKCRRTADEPTMEILQRGLESVTQSDQQAISHVWSLFSAAPAKQRELILSGILTQCCFPQLSYLATKVRDLIRIDFVSALPVEVSYKILCYLDTTSLCKAAQVSQRWRILADDDVVWHRMCEQHIERKCTKCGWGLPLLERKRLRDWKRQQQLRATGRGLNEWSPNLTPIPDDRNTELVSTASLKGPNKRDADSMSRADQLVITSPDASKRLRVDESYFTRPKFRPWKDVYKDRFKVGTNWKYGRCTMKILRGHTNGVMCLQFDDNILATGSYDSTIKIWNIDSGECIQTLRGHTSGIRAIQFDDNKLISGSLDQTLKVWNWRTGECMSTYRGHTAGVIGLNFDGNILASGSVDHTVKIWNFQDKSVSCLKGHTDWVNAVKVDAASRTVFSASDDCTVRLWDLDRKETIRIFEGHVGQVQQVALLPAEYEPEDIDEAEDHSSSSRASSVALSSSSTVAPSSQPYGDDWAPSRPHPPRYMITGSLDNNVRLWDVMTGRCLKTFFGHVEGIWALAGDTLRVVSGGEDRMVKVWDARTGKCERTFTGHAAPVTCIGLSDSKMITGSEDCEVRVYSFKSEDGARAEQSVTPAV